MTDLTLTVVGLGLIGGSVARSLRGKVKRIYAIDRDESVIAFASEQGVIDTPNGDPIPQSDVVMLCIYPDAAVEFVKSNIGSFKKGAILTDAVGIKTPLMNLYESLCDADFTYIGGHPMAGREVSGFINSLDNMFEGANFIITPPDGAPREKIAIIRRLAETMGCGMVIETTVENHDRVIAYTSQLPHAIATAMCDTPLLVKHKNYTGGSFEDVTRVAKINESLWSELFISNGEFLIEEIEHFCASLDSIKNAVKAGDKNGLEEIMRKVRLDKEMIDNGQNSVR